MRVGSTVVLVSVPDGLLAGLPEEDQEAIRGQVGKEVLFEGEHEGRVSVAFTDKEGFLHMIEHEGIEISSPAGYWERVWKVLGQRR